MVGLDLDGTLLDWELSCSTIDKNKKIKNEVKQNHITNDFLLSWLEFPRARTKFPLVQAEILQVWPKNLHMDWISLKRFLVY